jgi:hypothetical protein
MPAPLNHRLVASRGLGVTTLSTIHRELMATRMVAPRALVTLSCRGELSENDRVCIRRCMCNCECDAQAGLKALARGPLPRDPVSIIVR